MPGKEFKFPFGSKKLSPEEEIDNAIWTTLHFLVVLSTGGRHDKSEDDDMLPYPEQASNEFNYADAVIRKMQERDHYRRVVRILAQAFIKG